MKTIVFLASVALTATAFAQPAASTTSAAPARTPARAVRDTVSPLWAALDVDRDGVLSKSEIKNASLTLAALDANNDGVLSLAEFHAAPPSATEPLMRFVRRSREARSSLEFSLQYALDANHDDEIQPIEVACAASSLQRLDLNGDGVVSRDELGVSSLSSRVAARL